MRTEHLKKRKFPGITTSARIWVVNLVNYGVIAESVMIVRGLISVMTQRAFADWMIAPTAAKNQ